MTAPRGGLHLGWLHIAPSLLQVGEQAYDGDSELRKEVQALQERRLLRTLAVIQDVSDSMLALNDIRGEVPGHTCLDGLLHSDSLPLQSCSVYHATAAELCRNSQMLLHFEQPQTTRVC